MTSRWTLASAVNLIVTSHLRRRYYSAARVRADTSALSIPVTLILWRDDTRHDRRECRCRNNATRALRGTGEKHRQLPNSRLLLRLTIQKD
ncbi:unnamed protein product, partial [Brenthis ino]